MNHNAEIKPLQLEIIGKGAEVEKIQKRLRCAARATGSELQLSWLHEYPQTVFENARHSIAVSNNNELLIDGLVPTEEIETVLKQLTGKR